MTLPGGHVLAIDVGTSAARVTAVTIAGEVIAGASVAGHPLIEGDRAEMDAQVLWTSLLPLIRQVVERTGVPLGLGVASQLGLVVVDSRLAPIGLATLWQDRRAVDEAEELQISLGDRAAAIAGRAPSPESAAARLLWLAHRDPHAWRRARWVLSLKDFLIARLSGQVLTDATSASYSLLFDVRNRAWSPDLASAAGVPSGWLPPVAEPAEADITLSAEAAASLDLPAGLPIAIGGPDGSVAAIGSGAVRAGRTCDVAGSTDVLLHVVDRPVSDPAGRSVLNAYLLPGLWTVGGPTGMTGGAVAWLTAVLGFPSVDAAYAALGAEVDALPPGAGGVIFRTSMTGERFPRWSVGAAGAIAGLRPEHGAVHLLRAAEEGAAFAVREGIDAIMALGLDPGAIRICGGVARRPEAIRLRADAWQRTVTALTTPDATTVGVAMLTALRAGVFDTLDAAEVAMVRLGPPCEPERASAAAWDAAWRYWREA
jgi:xylulokinase